MRDFEKFKTEYDQYILEADVGEELVSIYKTYKDTPEKRDFILRFRLDDQIEEIVKANKIKDQNLKDFIIETKRMIATIIFE